MRLLPFLLLATLFAAGCRKERKIDVAAGLNPDKMPTMTTKNVATFISDSGIVMYKIVAPLWLVYDRVDTPCWRFPKGLYLQKFDRDYKPIASVAADSAIYFKDMHLWRLDGDVELKKAPGTLFVTQQLFWDERKHIMYSDSFMHVQTPTQMLEGYGFVSDEKMTKYSVRRPSGYFPSSGDHLSTTPGAPAPAPAVGAQQTSIDSIQ